MDLKSLEIIGKSDNFVIIDIPDIPLNYPNVRDLPKLFLDLSEELMASKNLKLICVLPAFSGISTMFLCEYIKLT